jgi:hypothetical protein
MKQGSALPPGTIEKDCTGMVKHLLDLPPDRGMIHYQWEVTEDIQDATPNVEFGWFGFIPMVILRGLWG